ncbi:hypothetical protein J844_3786, partial [Acinetobacter baumannii 24975_1]
MPPFNNIGFTFISYPNSKTDQFCISIYFLT